MAAIIVSAIFKASFGSDFYAQYAVVMCRWSSLVLPNGLSMCVPFVHQYWQRRRKNMCKAARVMGFKAPRIMFRLHILTELFIANFVSTVQVANAIMSEAALSFLGLGLLSTTTVTRCPWSVPALTTFSLEHGGSAAFPGVCFWYLF